MATYEVEGKRYELPDNLTEEETTETLKALYVQGQQNGDVKSDILEKEPVVNSSNDSIDPDLLYKDNDWLEASRRIYQLNEGKTFDGSNENLAEYGLEYMGWFNYNLPKMAYEANQLRSAPQDQKDAFLYLMDTYDNLEMSWGGTGRFFKGVLSDPTTWSGLASLGLGTAVSQGVKQATKQGIKTLLKQGMRTGIIAGVEGSIYGAADNAIRQSVEVTAGRKQKINRMENLAATATGGLLGFAGGTLLDAASTKVGQLIKSRIKSKEATQTETAVSEIIKHHKNKKAHKTNSSKDASMRNSDEEIIPAPFKSKEGSSEKAQEFIPTTDDAGALDTLLNRINKPERETNIPFESSSFVKQDEIANEISEILADFDQPQVQSIIEDLRKGKLTIAETNRFKTAVLTAREKSIKDSHDLLKKIKATKDVDQQIELTQTFEKTYRRMAHLDKLDEALSSDSGQVLGKRRGRTDLKHIDLNDIDAFEKAVENHSHKVELSNVKSRYDADIRQAEDAGNYAEAARLKILRSLEVEDELTNLLKKDGLPESKVLRFFAKTNELFISNVFSPTTVMINTVPSGLKTIYRPAMDALLSNPLKSVTRKKAMATYTAMMGSVKSAAKAARAAFRYEQSVLTRESGRLMEGELALGGTKISGKFAGKVRLFPRLLNTTDEFLSQIGYNGFIAGEAAGEAYERGIKKGLKGKALDKHVKQSVSNALEKAYGNVDDDAALRTIINKGRNLGYQKEELAQYVKNEITRSGNSTRHGTNEEALDYVRDLLYKRRFSGKTMISRAASRYEEFVKDQPYIRMIGQLFFRTPVRVFEEGFRWTSGLQLITPNYLKDLTGKRGIKAQLRARGEALTAFTIAGWVLTEYAKGNLVGDGAYSSWKHQKARTDSDLPEPYTLKNEQGETWGFRSFDPFSVPTKVMINALDYLNDVSIREKQGVFTRKDEFQKGLATFNAGVMALTSAIRDANLMGGVQEIQKALQYGSDMESGWFGGMKFLAGKLKMLAPNTLHKIARTNDPTIDDPATFWQMLESRLLGGVSLGMMQKSSSKSYDILGNVRRMNDTGALWNIFSESTPEERTKGLPEVDLKVMRRLDEISRQTGSVFELRPKHHLLPDVDLRTRRTGDGKETLYDRWIKYYKAFPVSKALEKIIDAKAPVGARDIKGVTVRLIQQTINQFKDAAFIKLLSEETEIKESFYEYKNREATVKSGQHDIEQENRE